jgi:circadian clock protein KaiB
MSQPIPKDPSMPPPDAEPQDPSIVWDLRLYIAGQTSRSVAALANLKRICDEHMPGRYRVEIIDLVAEPQRAQRDQILAIPTLVRQLPAPARKIIGDLSQTDRVLLGLDMRPAQG